MRTHPLNVLILCTGNSCRSIMGEALVRELGQERLKAHSAGSQPVGYIHPEALATLRRHGLPTDGYTSKSLDIFDGQPVDILITVCASAARETCPVFSGPAVRAHWGLKDPGHVEGDAATVIAAFDRTFDILRRRIQAMVGLPLETMKPDDIAAELARIADEIPESTEVSA